MITNEIIKKANEIRTKIETELNTIIYRMIIQTAKSQIELGFLKNNRPEIITYIENNDNKFLIFLSIPVESSLSNIVLQKDNLNIRKKVSEDLLNSICKTGVPFWDCGNISFNMKFPLPFRYTDDEYNENDKKLNKSHEGSVIHKNFYTAL